MRIILILIIIAAIFAVVQSRRHNCKWDELDWQSWFNCVIQKSATEMPSTRPATTPETQPAAPETPQ
jgi:hypothetical protein